jgi:hypothetical protein
MPAEQIIDGNAGLLDLVPEVIELAVAVPYLHGTGPVDDDASDIVADLDLFHGNALGTRRSGAQFDSWPSVLHPVWRPSQTAKDARLPYFAAITMGGAMRAVIVLLNVLSLRSFLCLRLFLLFLWYRLFHIHSGPAVLQPKGYRL